jgi:UrcA family protein
MNINAPPNRRFAAVSSLVVLSMMAFHSVPTVARDSGSIHVQLVDLDLRTSVGRQTAYDRLHQAARIVCSRASDPLDLGRQIHAVACIDRTMAKATASLAQLAERNEPIQVANGASR